MALGARAKGGSALERKQFFTPERKQILKPLAGNALFWVLTLLYLETVLHLTVFGGISARYPYLIGFTVVIGMVFSGLTQGNRRGNGLVSLIVVCVLCVLYDSQIVYHAIFGSMYSLSMMGMGGQAVTSFFKEMMLSILENLFPLLMGLLPIPATCLLRKFAGETVFGKLRRPRLILLAAAAVLQVVMLLTLRIGGTGFYTIYSYYHGNDATTDQSADSFGLLTTFRLEFQKMFGRETETDYFEPTGQAEVQETVYGYNVLDIDFDALSAKTEDERIQALNDYCASLTGTQKNEYTGMLEDYNLIVLCAESFSSAAIDPELTPTLYRMANEGIVFNNYYNTFPNTTTDGEYALCMGLMPDTGRGKRDSSFYASRNSYLPMALGNIFAEQRGVESYGYHNYLGSYYGRYLSHPNMGYKMKFAGAGMNFTTSWPASDLEMMEQSLPDYLSQEQFNAYYMTFSGHYKYNTAVNPMAVRNYDAVRDLPYSEPAKCYLSCNIELEKAMAYLMEQLEQAGVADRTAIVLAGDHFPYGLTNGEYDELIGHETDYFERYKDTLIFWVGGLEEPIVVDEYCCNMDVLPTILNLWGFDFDSRLLAGTDVFSEGTHMAVLADQSFLTDKVWFDANTNTAVYQVDESTLEPNYLDNMIRTVKNKFTISASVLNTAYYNFVFGKDSVVVDTSAWITEEEWNGTDKQETDEESTDPNGEVTDPNGEVTDPNGEVTDPNGEVTDPNGEVTDPNGEVTDPNGAVTDPNGEVTDPNGAVTDPNGEVTDPNAEVIDPEPEQPVPQEGAVQPLTPEEGQAPAESV